MDRLVEGDRPSIPPLRPGDVGLTVGTVNAVALYLELLAPVAVWLSWRDGGLDNSARSLQVLASLRSSSPALAGRGSGAMVGEPPALAALCLARRRQASTDRSRRVAGARIAVIVVAVAAMVVAGPLLLARLLTATPDASSSTARHGRCSRDTRSPASDPARGRACGRAPPISDANFAVLATSHDSVLQVLAELGVLGAAAAAWLARPPSPGGLAARLPSRRLRTSAACARSARRACIAALAHSLVDTQVHIPAVVILSMYLVARLDPVRSDAG